MTKKSKPRYGLSRAHTRRPAKEYVDFDYIESLSDEEKDWLDVFSRNYYQNTFYKDERDKLDTPELRRKAYSAENSRNRDIFTNSFRDDSAANQIVYWEYADGKTPSKKEEEE